MSVEKRIESILRFRPHLYKPHSQRFEEDFGSLVLDQSFNDEWSVGKIEPKGQRLSGFGDVEISTLEIEPTQTEIGRSTREMAV
jgi:hypothetical protein